MIEGICRTTCLAAAHGAGADLKLIVVDLLPVTMIDATGIYTTQEVAADLARRGVALAAAGRQTEWRIWARSRNFSANVRLYPTLRAALKAFRRKESPFGP